MPPLSDNDMSEEEEAMEDASGSSEAEISASDPDEDEEEVLEPKVLPQRLTRGGKMNQVRSSPISINPKNISFFRSIPKSYLHL